LRGENPVILRVANMTINQQQLLPPIPFDQLRWHAFPERFDDRTVRQVMRSVHDSDITSLRQQVDILANIIRSQMKIPLIDAELSQLSGHTGEWAQGMISRHLLTIT
jgi:hypothetical protein